MVTVTDDHASVDMAIWLTPARRGGAPCLGGHRLDPEQMAERVWAGLDVEQEILGAYGISYGQLILSCWYVAEHGTRRWRRRWGAWVADVWQTTHIGPPATGWWGDWDEIRLPPSKDDPA